MDKEIVDKIKEKLQTQLYNSVTPYEAEAWAAALKSFMVAVGIENNLKEDQ